MVAPYKIIGFQSTYTLGRTCFSHQSFAGGVLSWNLGTYLALITVCRRQQEGDRALSIYEVSCYGLPS